MCFEALAAKNDALNLHQHRKHLTCAAPARTRASPKELSDRARPRDPEPESDQPHRKEATENPLALPRKERAQSPSPHAWPLDGGARVWLLAGAAPRPSSPTARTPHDAKPHAERRRTARQTASPPKRSLNRVIPHCAMPLGNTLHNWLRQQSGTSAAPTPHTSLTSVMRTVAQQILKSVTRCVRARPETAPTRRPWKFSPWQQPVNYAECGIKRGDNMRTHAPTIAPMGAPWSRGGRYTQ